jgi:lysozyme family protein
VNSGVKRAAKVLQRLIGFSGNDVDGVIGPRTLGAVSLTDPSALINAICDERLAFLEGLSTWPVFGNGWGRRVREVRAAALAMAERAATSPPSTIDPPPNPVVPAQAGIQDHRAAPRPPGLVRTLAPALAKAGDTLRHLFNHSKGD